MRPTKKHISEKTIWNFGTFFVVAVLISGLLRHSLPLHAALPEDSTLKLFLFLAVLGGIAVQAIKEPRARIIPASSIYLLLVLILVIQLIGFASTNSARGLTSFWNEYGLQSLAVLAFIIGSWASINRDFPRTVLPLLIASTIISTIGIITGIFDKPIDPLGNPNYTGAFIALCAPLATPLISYKNNNNIKKIAVAFVLLSLISLAFVFKHRAGTMAAVVGLGFIWAFNNSTKLKKKAVILLLIFLGIFTALTFIKGDGLSKILSSSSYTSRASQYAPVFDAVKDSPLVGYGAGSYTDIGYSYSAKIPGQHSSLSDLGFFNHPHNDWLEILVEGGIISAVIFLFFILFVTIRLGLAYREDLTNKSYILAIAGSFIVYILIGLISIANQTPAIMVLVFYIMGLAASLRKKVTRSLSILSRIQSGLLVGLLIIISSLGTILSLKHDYDTRMFFERFLLNPEEGIKVINESRSYFVVTNGISVASNVLPEQAASTAKQKYEEIRSPFIKLMQLNAEMKSSNSNNQIDIETLKHSLNIFPEDGITLTGALIFSAYENDLQGFLFSIKKQLGKSLIKNKIASPSNSYTTKIILSQNNSSLHFDDSFATLTLNEDLVFDLTAKIRSGILNKDEGAGLSMSIYNKLIISSSSLDMPDAKAAVAADIALFLGLATTRNALRLDTDYGQLLTGIEPLQEKPN